MPIHKKKSDQLSLETALQELVRKHGLEALKKGSSKVVFGNELNGNMIDQDIAQPVTFEKAKMDFFNSDRYNSLSLSTKNTYSCEMNILEKNHVNSLEKGVNVLFEDLFTSNEYNHVVLGYLNADIQERTKQKKKAFLRCFIQATTHDFYQKNKEVFSRLLKIKQDINSLPKYLDLEQISELLNLSKLSSSGLRNYTMLRVFLGTGIRINELKLLQVGDICRDTQNIMIYPKGNKNSKKPRKISSVVLKELENYVEFTYAYLKDKDNYKDLYIFSTDEGRTPLTDRAIQYIVKNLILRAESIPEERKEHLNCHSFRHSFAVHALHSGIDIYTISNLLGHKNISSTEIYLSLFDEDLRNAIEQHPFANINIRNLK